MGGKCLWLSMWIFVCGLLTVQLSPLALRAFLYPYNGRDDPRADTFAEGRPRSGGTPTVTNIPERIWGKPNDLGYGPCVEPDEAYCSAVDNKKYLYVHCNGGLNQMRAGICDMVAIARLMNVTLVLPEVDKESFWQDESEFADIFDEDYFLEALKEDVRIVKKLPEQVTESQVFRVPKGFQSWSDADYYQNEIASLYKTYSVVKVTRSDARLANNDLPADIQKLRCRVHYDALRFHPAIEELGHKLVKRMRDEGPFIALHLRYEKDMLAFSGCTHDLSQEEADELTRTRLETKHWRVKDIDGDYARQTGTCPMTPKEVGLMLRAMGFPNTTIIYIAAGEIYGGESHMADLRTHFPRILRKESVATAEELAPFAKHQSRMAALDYIVAVESNVFIPTYSGNMARAVEGHRRFLGHRRTITPDRKELVSLFDKVEQGEMQPGAEFAEAVELLHRNRQGAPRVRRGPLPGTRGRDRARSEECFYENPLPDCLCQDPNFKRNLKSRGGSLRVVSGGGGPPSSLLGGIWLTKRSKSADASR